MENLSGACLIGQSGGPTSAINATVYGVISAAKKCPQIQGIYGAANGILGILNENFYDLDKEDEAELDLLPQTPSSILGSCRYKLKSPEDDIRDYERILEVFKKFNIRYFFYVGGNDSMDTCNKISKFLQSRKYNCRVMGCPKTIDNDLFGTDHCPGYGSAAKFVATSVMEIKRDCCVYDYPTVCVVEVMGRNAGWLTAAAAIGNKVGEGADLVYLPEVTFDINTFLQDVKALYEKQGSCIIAVSEGIHDKDGTFISEYGSAGTASVDSFGHKQMGGVGQALVSYIKENLEIKKLRSIELSLMQRCAAHCQSKTDISESIAAGSLAVERAVAGETDKMVIFERAYDENGNYKCELAIEDLALAANQEKMVPVSWITSEKNQVTSEYIDYALPLVQGECDHVFENGLLKFTKLKKIPVKAPVCD